MNASHPLRRIARCCPVQLVGLFVATAILTGDLSLASAQCGNYVILLDDEGRPTLHNDDSMADHRGSGESIEGGRFDLSRMLMDAVWPPAPSNSAPCHGINCRRSNDESITAPPTPPEQRRDLTQWTVERRPFFISAATGSRFFAVELLAAQSTGDSQWRPPRAD